MLFNISLLYMYSYLSPDMFKCHNTDMSTGSSIVVAAANFSGQKNALSVCVTENIAVNAQSIEQTAVIGERNGRYFRKQRIISSDVRSCGYVLTVCASTKRTERLLV